METPSPAMKWVNLVGYQVLWFALVIGAARGAPEWPLLAGALFVIVQVAFSGHIAGECRLLGMAVLFALVVDGVPAILGWWRYASPSPSLPPGGAPAWILMLWLCFATTLRRSLSFIRFRPVWAAVLGAIGAPLAYLGAAHGWMAVMLPQPPHLAVAWLAVTWGIALPVLAHMAGLASMQPMARPS
ncbi:MAG: hypothetical protein GAK28_00541 [Luteibacter sp.]|uniref:DUF2878 domain-containing protein n=1 Tax=Luteibacter sp. TaxID=1886636 RepID=UPI00137E43D7|nr:DUF2878 domain-containing protein [Luteibacter sp.]KAF1008909.1 MAG: hypothetical protein GAK28_00541 [Luteibacter sp.]